MTTRNNRVDFRVLVVVGSAFVAYSGMGQAESLTGAGSTLPTASPLYAGSSSELSLALANAADVAKDKVKDKIVEQSLKASAKALRSSLLEASVFLSRNLKNIQANSEKPTASLPM
jgi:hypothetical protein